MKTEEVLLNALIEKLSLKDLIKNISININNPVIVVDSGYRIISSSMSDKITDKYWISNLKKGYCSFEFISELKKILESKEIPDDSTPYILNCPGSNVTRYVSKIMMRGIHYGYVVILDNVTPFNEDTADILEKISKAVSSVYLDEFTLPENEDSKSQFISSILLNDLTTSENINKDIERYNIKIDLPMKLMILKEDDKEIDKNKNLIIEKTRNFLPSSIIINMDRYLVIADKESEIDNLILQDNWMDFLKLLKITAIVSEHIEELIDLNQVYRLMMMLIESFNHVLNNYQTYNYSEYKTLLLINNDGKIIDDISSFISEPVLRLEKHDKKYKSHYIEILKTLLKWRFSKTEAAKELFIHRNSLSYHISKMEKIAKINLEDSSLDSILNLSIMLLEMSKK